MEEYLEKANAALDKAAPLVPEQNKVLFESQAYPIRWLYHSVRTQSNFSKSCMIRNELIPLSKKESLDTTEKARAQKLYDDWRAILKDELVNSRTAAPIARADVRLDCYFRGDHMFNHLWDMVDAKIALVESELEVFLPQVATKCGLNTQ